MGRTRCSLFLRMRITGICSERVIARSRSGIRILLAGLLILVFSANKLYSQVPDSLPPAFQRFPTIPPFVLKDVRSGGSITREQLSTKRPTILIFFSPDCHHCIDQALLLKDSREQLLRYNLVLATYNPMDQLEQFVLQHGFEGWKNMYIGRDENYFLPDFFRINDIPFIALYNRRGKLVTHFEKTTEVSTILQAFEASPLPLQRK